MAGNYTVDVSVALKAQQASIKNIRKQIETEFGEVDFNSSVGKKLAKLFDQFDNRISNMDSILGKGALNTNDLGKLASLFDSMNMIVGQMHSAVGKAPMMDLGLDPSEFPELVAAMEKVKKLQTEMAAESKKSSKETLTAMNKQDALDKLNKLENTKASQDKSLHENAAILEAEHKQRIEAEQKLQQELASLEAKRKSKQQERDREQRMAAEAEEAARKKEIELKDKQALSKNSVDKMTGQKGKALNAQKKSIQSFLEEVYSESAVAAQNHLSESNLAGSLLKAMFSPDELEGMAEYTAQQLREAFQKKLFSSDGNSVNQDAAQFFGSKIQEWQKAHPGSVTQTQNSVTALRQQVSVHSQNADMADLDAKSVGIEIDQKTEELANLSVEAANLHAAATEIRAAAQAFQAALNKKYDPQMDQARKEVSGAEQDIKGEQFPSSKPGNPVFSPEQLNDQRKGIEQQEDADSFTTKMKGAIKQWMGAREVIGYIKQGVRSAYQDIQSLDKAMTNIAVVTDMSTSDLWGKINDYMGMAQQYGVTTQGVYEVSQLFFQQGLGESDTMAATVETLKMARIAGMDYKDAADGMTVAIRGFNMEMSEAAHVTDVYSKVAAITASDTQELVTAMSKTASSAASVGSSFENTTAMLAVMVEATRESPQNIGSAMKSIISRYGEMTKGLSEDSEGEEIDYNRVDTALKSIGISLKDAQGQFRDFDDVIFELSGKWDTLDSVTQRYIATIFAGNRQQSRFLALVSNADRLQEVSDAAANSEDAGLLQYSKTMDSLESKTNSIKTGFQQFYMDIFNGPAIGKFLDFINKVIEGFNRLSNFQAILNMGSMIAGIKALVTVIIQPFSQIASVIANAIEDGFRRGHANSRDEIERINNDIDGSDDNRGRRRSAFGQHVEDVNANYGGWIQAGEIVGGTLSAVGTRVGAENARWGTAISGIGNTVSYAAMGAQVGGIYGAIIGALAGVITTIASWPSELEMAQQELEKAKEKAQEAQIERAQAKERETGLEETIEKLNELKKHQYDSAEAQQEFVDANNEAFEKFPDLAATFDEFGNAFINIESAEQALALARESTAAATLNATRAEMERLRQDQKTNRLAQEDHLNKVAARYTDGWSSLDVGDDFTNRFLSRAESIGSVSTYSTANGGAPYWDVMNQRINEAQEEAREQFIRSRGGDPDTWEPSNQQERRELNNAISEAGQAARVDPENVADAQNAFYADAFDYSLNTYLNNNLGGEQTTNFVNDLLGDRIVTQFEAEQRGGNTRANIFSTTTYDAQGNEVKTYDEIADRALEFILRGADNLDLTDQGNIDFLTSLSNMSDETDALNAVLSNYSTLKFKSGINPTEFLAGYLNYDLSDADEKADFFEMLGTNATYNNKEAGYAYAMESTKDTQIASNVRGIINQDESLKESINNITGLGEFIQQRAGDLTDELGNEANLDMAETAGLINPYLVWAEDFSQRAETINADEEASDLFASAKAGKISKTNLEEQLHLIGLDPSEDSYLQEYVDSIYENVEETKNNVITALHQSPITWTTHVTQRDVSGQVDIDNLLNEIAPNYYSAITDFKNYLVESIDSGKMTNTRANHVAREFISVWEATTNLPVEQVAQAQQLLSEADLTTTLGKEDLKSQLEEAGITDEGLIGQIDGVYPYAENLVTQYGSLQDKVIANLENLTEALQNASNGMEISEALKTAEKIGMDLSEAFNFQDGKYIAKDVSVLEKIRDAYAEEQTAALDASLANQLEILEDGGGEGIFAGYRTEEVLTYNPNAAPGERPYTVESVQIPVYEYSEEYEQLLAQYGDAALAWYDGLSEEAREAEGLNTQDDTLRNKIKAYLIDYNEEVARAIEENAQHQFEEAAQAVQISNRAYELKGDRQQRNLTEAYSLLSSKGLTGYSADDIAALETYLGVGAGGLGAAETGVGTGEYEIDGAMLENLTTSLPQWVRNSINTSIEETIESTKEGFESVAEAMASGENLSTAEISQMLGEGFEGLDEVSAGLVRTLYQNALDTGNFEELETVLKLMFQERGATETEATRMAAESVARFKDNISDDATKLIDLQLSMLEGDISAEDANYLASRGIDITNLVSRTQEAIAGLVQSIVDNADFSFEDKVSNLQKVYDTGLESLLGYETSIAETLTSREGFSRSDATSMMAELTALGIQTSGIFEESADGTKFYLNNLEDIMGDIETSMSTMDQGSEEYAAANNLLKQINYIREWQPYELADSMGSTIEEMANATEVSTIEMRNFYKELTGRDISVEDAQRLATELNELDPVARIEQLVAIVRQSGIEVEGMEERLAETAANVLDTIIEAISNGMSSIGEGLSGTLSFASLNELMQKYNLSVQDSFGTASGAALGEQDRRNLITAMYQEAKASGLQTGFGDQLWETFRDSDNNPYAGYNALEGELADARYRVASEVAAHYQSYMTQADSLRQQASFFEEMGNTADAEAALAAAAAAEEMANNTSAAAEEARAYAEALEQARAAAMFDENAYEFTFMEQDATSGLTKNADNFINQIDAVKTAFQSFKNDESIGYQDFYNMMDFLNNTGQWESFSENVGMAGRDYEEFVNSVVAHTDEWGKVDIGGVAAEMGISVDAAMTAMSDSMKSGLIEVAKQQVDYLTGLENMLKAMAALESIGDIGLGISVTIDGQAKTVEEWIASWNDLDEDTKKEFILKMRTEVEDDQLFDWTGVDQGMRDALDIMFGEGFGNSLDSLIFTRNEAGGIVDVASTEIARQYMELASAISKASEDSSGETAQGMAHAMQNVQGMYMDRLGYAMGEDGLWRDAQGQLAELTATQNAELLKLLNDAAKNATPMDIADFSERYLQALNAGDTHATISEGRTIELNWDGTTTITDANGDPLTPEAVRALDAEAIAQMEAELNQNRADADHYYDLIVDAQGRLTYNIIPVGDVGAVLENTPDTITVDDGQGAYRVNVVVNTETQTITFNGPNGPLTGEDLQQAMDTYASQMNLSDRGIELNADENGTVTLVPTITPAPSNTEILTQIASDIQAIKDSLLQGFDITLNDQATSVLGTIQSAYDELRAHFVANPLVARMIQVGGISLPNIPTNFPTTQAPSGVGPFAGTMNGLAFADGSLGRLHSGAVLANKALVGELGPELAVYDGQYHMLGANGAEFVDLPSDAIIFNHLQTQGILRGQMNIRGTAMADGNVSGPAYAGGIGAALSAVSRAKSVWQGLLSSLTAADLLDGGGGGGGGGGGESLKAHIADLQEWYNLSRQIAKIESEINTLISKRNNLTDGHEYLRNLRETQSLLDDQVDTQKDLLRFQELQLQAQAEHINTNEIWSKFLKVDENGLLQYIEGNETNGGKGALEVLSKMNEMSGEEQLAYVQSLGWSYTTTDGEELEEAQLVAKFYEELQKQIDDYDALADTVNEAESALEDLEGQINEIEKEIRDNEIDLSQEIYDIIVDAWKENIENLKEQNDLIKEANEAYAQGIEKAISAERELYEQNQSIQEREQMQRQLALLRRSGGSASEIANLEAQLDEKLKEEYFANQEKALEDIREANERQVELMEQQVKIQEEQLKYQEENGVIWSKVYEVMQGTDAEILQFMQGNSTEFFQKSYLQQEDMLTEWAKKIGIYNEEKLRKVYDAEAAASLDDTWASEEGQSLISAFNKASTEQQQKWLREYRDTYTAAMLNDESEMEAISTAREEMFEHIRHWIEAEEEAARRAAQEAQAASNNNDSGSSSQKTQYNRYVRVSDGQGGEVGIVVSYSEMRKLQQQRIIPEEYTGVRTEANRTPLTEDYRRTLGLSTGGLVDETGFAILHGSPSRPERVLSAEQTRILEEGLAMNAGRGTKLQEALQGFAYSLGSSIQSSIASVIKDSNNVNAFNIQPGAVVLQIAELNDKYDVDELFNDVADRLYSIAAKSSGRSVSRR